MNEKGLHVRTSIKDWLWSQHAPPEVLADFERLFKLPEKWISQGYWAGMKICSEELSAILEGKD